MPTDTRFIPITVALDGTQATIEFNRLANTIIDSASHVSGAIGDSIKQAYSQLIDANERAFAQFQSTQSRIASTLEQSLEAQTKFSEAAERQTEVIEEMSEAFDRLSEKIGESGEKSESFLTKYHEGTASIVYTLEILEKGHERLNSTFGKTEHAQAEAHQAFGLFQKAISTAFNPATKEAKALSDSFRRLGIDASSALTIANSKQSFQEFLTAFRALPNVVYQSNVAVEIFGSEAAKLLPILRGSTFALGALGTAISVIGAGIAVVLVPLAIKAASAWAEYGSEIYHVHQATGLASRDLSVIRAEAGSTGIKFDQLSGGLKYFSAQLYEAGSGGKKAAANLDAAGLSADVIKRANGELLPMLSAVAKKLGDTGDAFEKNTLIAKAFGKGIGPEMATFLSQFNGHMEAAIQAATAAGLVFDDVGARKAVEFKEALASLETGVKTLELQIGQALAPVLLNILKNIYPIITGLGQWIAQNQNTILTVARLAAELYVFVTAMKAASAILAIMGVEAGIASGGLTILLGVLATLGAVVVFDKLTSDIAGMGREMGAIQPTGVAFQNMFQGIVYQAKDAKTQLELVGIETEILAQQAIAAAAEMRAAGLLAKGIPAKTTFLKTGGSGYTSLHGGKVASFNGQTVIVQPAQTVETEMLKPDRFGRMHLDNANEATRQYLDARRASVAATEKEIELQGQLKKYQFKPVEINHSGVRTRTAKGNQNALNEAEKVLEIAHANEKYRATKEMIDRDAIQWKASYDQHLVTTEDFYKQERQLVRRAATAESTRNKEDIIANRDARKALQAELAKKPEPAEQDSINAALKRNEAEYTDLIGKQARVLADKKNKILEINIAQVKQSDDETIAAREAQSQFQESLGGQNALLAKLEESGAKLDGIIEKYTVDANAGVTSAIQIIDVARKEHEKLLLEAGSGEALAVQAAMKRASQAEQEIRQGVTLGIYNEVQARDLVLASQRKAIPVLQGMIALQKRIAASNPFNDEEAQKLREYELQLQTLGKDLEVTAREGRILHQMDIMPEHLNDNVRDFLSNITTMQQSLENFRTNIVKGVFSEVDKQIDKISSKMGPFKSFFDSTFGQLLKDQAHLQLAKQFEKIFGVKLPQSPQQQQISSTLNLTASNVSLKASIDGLTAIISGASSGVSDTTTRPRRVGASSGGPLSFGLPSSAMNEAGGTGFSGLSTIGGKSPATTQAISMATSPAGLSLWKKLGEKFGLGGSKSSGGGQLYNEDSGDPDGTSGGDSDSGGKSAAAMGIMSMAAGALNTGGKLGAVESGLMTAGQMMGPTPVGLALMAASLGLGLQAKIFGWGKGDQKAIHDAIKSDPLFGGLDIKDSKGDKVLDQIKQIGDRQWPGKVKQHVAQLIHEDQVKQLIDSFGEYDLKNNPNYAQSQLARTRQLSDIGATENQFTRRAMGGPVSANMPYLVGEKRPELFIPRVDGAIHPDPIGDMTRRVMDNARAKMSAPAGNQGHSQNALGFAIQSLVEQLSRLTAISPGQVLQTGAQQNPTAISGGLIEGLRQNFGHRRELNGITGA